MLLIIRNPNTIKIERKILAANSQKNHLTHALKVIEKFLLERKNLAVNSQEKTQIENPKFFLWLPSPFLTKINLYILTLKPKQIKLHICELRTTSRHTPIIEHVIVPDILYWICQLSKLHRISLLSILFLFKPHSPKTHNQIKLFLVNKAYKNQVLFLINKPCQKLGIEVQKNK